MKRQAYWSWINGEITRSPQIPLLSGAIQHGYGVFETIYFKNSLKLWSPHIRRFKEAAHVYGLELPYSDSEIQSSIQHLLTTNNLTEARVRLSLYAADTSYTSTLIPSILTITTHPYERTLKSVKLLQLKATDTHCSLSQEKSSSYAGYQLAKRHAILKGYDEALLSNTASQIIECSSANIIFYQNGNWITPCLQEQGLHGLQLKHVTSLMKRLNIPLLNQPVTTTENSFAFITNSLIGLQTVSSISEQAMSAPPESYQHLLNAWEKSEEI